MSPTYQKYGAVCHKLDRFNAFSNLPFFRHEERTQVYIPPDADIVDNARQRESERVKDAMDSFDKPLWARGIDEAVLKKRK
jgi:hypothetical protein